MHVDREARRPVVREHPLPHRRLRQVRRRRRRLERKRELLLLASRPGNRLRARHESELPQELAAGQPEAVARARLDEGDQLVARQPRPLGEVADVRERTVRVPLGDDRLRVVLPHALDVRQPDAHRAVLDVAAGSAQVHVGRPRLDAVPLRVAHERRRRVEAHRLRVHQRREELLRVVVAQPGRLVREQPERGRVRLRKAEPGEADELVVDHVRGRLVDALPLCAFDEAGAVRLERREAPLPAHRAPQPLRLADGEAGEMDGDVEHLVLEDDDAERLPQRLLQQGMVRGRDIVGVLAQLLPPLDVRVHRLPLDRPGTDERHLDRDVVEVLRPRAQQRLHLRTALDLEAADRVGALDLRVHRRDRRAGRATGRSARRGGARSGRRTPRPPTASPARAGRSSGSRRPRTSPCPTGTSAGPPSPTAAPGTSSTSGRVEITIPPGCWEMWRGRPAISRQSSANARQRGERSFVRIDLVRRRSPRASRPRRARAARDP